MRRTAAAAAVSSATGTTRRWMSSTTAARIPLDRWRNFGIIAHIDAGKTTISERILYYAGRTRHIGEVHDGDTVMDHMAEERQRGITISSSCISLHWRDYRLNLIDSPGHVDFTVEVERCMRVLDGAVTVLDAVAGVQVQTETVWSQAETYHVPRIAFVNKMDRDGADLDRAADSIRTRLGVTPWLLQRPILDRDGKLTGIVDLITLTGMQFTGKRGEFVQRYSVADHPDYVTYRETLLEAISDHDETVLVTLLDGNEVTPEMVHDAIRTAVRQRLPVVPVLCGAAYRDLGVQPLLDAVCDYLPPPTVDHVASASGDTLRALVFKIVHDGRRGPVALVRVYRGTLTSGDTLRVRNEKCRVGKLLQVDAGQYHEINECHAGDICAVVGLKQARTAEMLRLWNDRSGDSDSSAVEIGVPQPVFFCSIEADSSQDEDALKAALHALSVEDPSLHVTVDQETGQTVIKGMGELHLQVVCDRLRNEFNINATLGRMSVTYREAPTMSVTDTVTHQIAGRLPVSVTMTLAPSKSDSDDGVTVDRSASSLRIGDVTSPLSAEMRAVVDEIVTGLRGPLLGFPLCHTHVTLHEIASSGNVNMGDISAAVSLCLTSLIRSAHITLLEPIVELELHCQTPYVGDITSDLSRRRRGQVLHVTSTGTKGTVLALVPLAEMLGYATSVRSISQGTAYFSTRFKSFEPVPARVQHDLLHPSM